MSAGVDAEVGRILASASLWVRPEGADPLHVAGRVDGDEAEVARAVAASLATGRAAGARSASGSRVLAFPAPRRVPGSVAVLRIHDRADGASALAAARRLRSPVGLARWQADARARADDRHAIAVATIDRLLAAAEGFQRLAADRPPAGVPVDEVLEEERRAAEGVANALHDTAAQSIVAATRYLDAARGSVGSPAAGQAASHLDAARAALEAALRDVREVIDALAPPGLVELGVAEALRLRARSGGLRTTRVEVTGELSRGPGWLEAALFAMAVAAIDEVAAAGGARGAGGSGGSGSVRVALREVDGRRIIGVGGDEVGLDPATAPARGRGGMGRVGIGRRASWLGGRVEATRTPGAGLALSIEVPIDAAAGVGHLDPTERGGASRP